MPQTIRVRSQPANTVVSPQEGFNFDSYVIEAVAPVYYSYLNRPDAQRRVKPQRLFENATTWHVESGQFAYTHSSYKYRRDGGVYNFSGPSSYWARCPGSPYPLHEDPYVLSNLDLKLRGKIKNQKVDLLAALAEAHKTADLLTGVARDIVSSFGALRRGSGIAAVRRAILGRETRADRALANRWLQYQWGVLPTLNDIMGAAEALATRVHEGMYHYYKVSHQETRTFKYSVPMEGQGTWLRRHTAKVRVKFSSPELMELSRLGITNPLASAYQLIPWSFAADWVSNLGDILSGLDALIGVNEVVIQRGVGVDVTHSYVLAPQGGGCVGAQRSRKRLLVDSDLSYGSLTLTGPFDTNSPGMRFANAAALARQLYR